MLKVHFIKKNMTIFYPTQNTHGASGHAFRWNFVSYPHISYFYMFISILAIKYLVILDKTFRIMEYHVAKLSVQKKKIRSQIVSSEEKICSQIVSCGTSYFFMFGDHLP